MMLSISIGEFRADIDHQMAAVQADGEIVEIDAGHGKVVLMNEDEFKIMRQALIALLGTT